MDVILTGSSRPDLLEITLKTWKKFLHTEQNLRWIIHEDVKDKEKSKRSQQLSNLVADDVIVDNPPCGIGHSIDKLLSKVKCKYALYLQDDWELERPVELDKLTYIMDKNPNINQIIFPKMKIREYSGDFKHKVWKFENQDFTINNGWYLNPAIWRIKKVREKWTMNGMPKRAEGFFTNRFGSHEQRLSVNYCFDKMGSFFLGAIGDYRYTRHLGGTFRKSDFRLDDSSLTFEVFEYKHKAPWISYKKRPINRKCGVKFSPTNKDQFYRELELLPDDVRKHIFGKNMEYLIEKEGTVR